MRRPTRTCHSAAYVSPTDKQERFTISEMAADWHELMIPRRIIRSVVVCSYSEQYWTHDAAHRHATARNQAH